MTTLLIDSHVIHWWASERQRLSPAATSALNEADELAASGISWFELAWLAAHDRIEITTPIRTWLEGLAADVRTVGISPAIAGTAASLPRSFPNDPADRLIYATAIEHGWPLVTRDERLRAHGHPGIVTVW